MLKRGGSGGSSRPSDPHLGLRYWVQIEGIEIAGFAECSGLSMETEVFEYTEGGQNTYTHKLPVRTKYSNITLKRGLDPTRDLFTWFVNSKNGAPRSRKDVSIIVYNSEGREVYRWDLIEAYPVKWTGPDYRTDAGAVAVETIEIAHHGLAV
jgi:phage tail-like protein